MNSLVTLKTKCTVTVPIEDKRYKPRAISKLGYAADSKFYATL